MFETAIAFADGGDEKNVARHRRRFAEETDLPFADALEVGAEALHIAVVPATDGDFVRHTASLEAG